MTLEWAKRRLAAINDQLETYYADLALRWLKQPKRVANGGDDGFVADMMRAAKRAASLAPIGVDALLARVDLRREDVITFAANEAQARHALAYVGCGLAGPLFRYRQFRRLNNKFTLIERTADRWTNDLGFIASVSIQLGTVNAVLGELGEARQEAPQLLLDLRDGLRRDIMSMQVIDERAAARFTGRNLDLHKNVDHNNEMFAALRSIVDNRLEHALVVELARIVGHEVDVDGYAPAASLSQAHRELVRTKLGLEDFAPYSRLIDGVEGDKALELAAHYRRGERKGRATKRAELEALLRRHFDDVARNLEQHAAVLVAARSYLSRRNIAWALYSQLMDRQGGVETARAGAPEDDVERDGAGPPDLADGPDEAQPEQARDTGALADDPGDHDDQGGTETEAFYEDDSYWQRRPSVEDAEAERRGEQQALLMVSAPTQLLVLAKKHGVAYVPKADQPLGKDLAMLEFGERKLVYAASSSTLKRSLENGPEDASDEAAIDGLCRQLAEHVHRLLAATQEKGARLKEILSALCIHWRQHTPHAADQLLAFDLNARGGFALTGADYREFDRWTRIARAECSEDLLPRKYLLRHLAFDREAFDDEDEAGNPQAPGSST